MKARWMIGSLWFAAAAHAVTTNGVTFPDEMKIDDTRLVLNGVGVREATIFDVDVYVAGLYLERRSNDPEAILESPGMKRIEMRFVRHVDADSMTKAWKEGLQKNCVVGCGDIEEQVRAAVVKLGDMKEGDSLSYTFYAESVVVFARGKEIAEISGVGVGRVLLSVWLGPDPASHGLKRGMLGLPAR